MYASWLVFNCSIFFNQSGIELVADEWLHWLSFPTSQPFDNLGREIKKRLDIHISLSHAAINHLNAPTIVIYNNTNYA